jgi:cytochrome P450
MTVQGQAPKIEYNPFAYEMHEDPYPVYRAMREHAPVYYNDEIGFWALSRHADVLAGFKNTENLSNAYGVSLEPSAHTPDARRMMSFLAMDPPEHDIMRALVSRGFTPRRVSAMEPRIREIAAEHIDEFIAQGRCDFIPDFAGKLPMDVISEMLGVPVEERAWLREAADTVVHREEGMLDVPEAGLDASLRMVAYFDEHIARKRAAPADDLTSALLVAEVDGKTLAHDDILAFLFLMIIAGNETTTKLLGNSVYWAARNPEQRALVNADHSLIGRWVEETLRYDNSTQSLARRVRRPFSLHGHDFAIGDRVALLVGSANRDEAVFPEADKYDIMRDCSNMLSFGYATHFCLGASLARLEGRVALEEVVRRLPDYEIDFDGIRRVHSINVRGFANLPMQFTAGHA